VEARKYAQTIDIKVKGYKNKFKTLDELNFEIGLKTGRIKLDKNDYPEANFPSEEYTSKNFKVKKN
jgi:hypothetical protein